MLNRIPKLLSPALVKAMMEMGHGDYIVIADAHFPATSLNDNVIRADGLGVPELLEGILALLPLDIHYSDYPVELMAVVNEDETPKIWDVYKDILRQHYSFLPSISYLERFSFYDVAKSAFAVVATGEEAIYANIILKKGIVS